jgi:hypothetical protein
MSKALPTAIAAVPEPDWESYGTPIPKEAWEGLVPVFKTPGLLPHHHVLRLLPRLAGGVDGRQPGGSKIAAAASLSRHCTKM